MFSFNSPRLSSKRSRSRLAFKPRLEELESRLAPAVFNVTASTPDGAPGSLRDAIN
jgi:hypothetical protein